MQSTIIVIGALLLLLLLLAIRTPVAFSLGITGVAGLVALRGIEGAGPHVTSVPYSSVASASLAVVPMFIMMGMLASSAGVPENIFRIANRLLRKVPGGLGIATVFAGAGFAAVTGSSIASAATMGKMSIGEMLKVGYTRQFAAGVVAAAGTLGVLIPPSVILVFYGIVTGESIGALLLAGVIPGILSAFALAIAVLLRARFTPSSIFEEGSQKDTSNRDDAPGPFSASLSTLTRGGHANQSTYPRVVGEASAIPASSWRHLVWVGLIFSIVIGGIYGGIFTATESGAIGALTLCAVLIFEKRKTGLKGLAGSFMDAVRGTASTSAMMLAIVIGASLFSQFLVASGVTSRFVSWMVNLPVSAVVLMALLILLLVVMGTVLETLSLILITMPLIYPVAIGLGFDGIWLGIVAAKAIEIGLLTPPVGMNVYVVAGTHPRITVEDGFRGVVPFIIIEIILLCILFMFPEIVTFLPSTMR